MSFADEPDALKCPVEKQRRQDMLEQPHIKPLADYLEFVRKDASAQMGQPLEMPCFDPCDGGIDARALFLLEAPGPKAVGSEFISRNNPDPTARNLCELLQKADIPRRDTLIWNIVPWYVGENGHIMPVGRKNLAKALPYLKVLIDLLPSLEVIVLVGRQAQSAEEKIKLLTSARIEKTYHPAARVRHRWPDKWAQTQEKFNHVGKSLREGK